MERASHQESPDARPQAPADAQHESLSIPRRILIVEDNDLARRELQRLLQEDPQWQVDAVREGEEALRLLSQHDYSLALTDLRLPGRDGLDLLKEMQRRGVPATVIVITGHGSIDEAVQALHLGAYDFLTKPIDVEHLRVVVRRALRERALLDELTALRSQLQTRYSFHNILSKNPQMHAIFELISNIAYTNTTVLIEGETGTGKEQTARAIHEASQNRTGPLVAVNCAALPETLLESELFGHEKGAFTSAVSQRRGRFEMANGGTIFLDEVGDVPLPMQAKLLRVLQERRFERVGGAESIEVDVRVIAATNRNLKRLVAQGTFREDLYYRLNVVKIDLPPLRERPEDIPLLATHFIGKCTPQGQVPKQIAPRAMEVLLNYRWPGNIRELENAIERACITSRDNVIQVENLPPEITAPAAPRLPFHIDLDRPLPELLRDAVNSIERQYITKALKKTRGNVSRCARICGMSRRSITGKIAEYRLDKSAYK
jgi:DNA-binding NtrC family response regulator